MQHRYLEAGAGQTIVLTVDPPMTIAIYAPLLAIFAERFRVVVVEPPAMGFTATSRGYGFGFSAISAFLDQS